MSEAGMTQTHAEYPDGLRERGPCKGLYQELNLELGNVSEIMVFLNLRDKILGCLETP